MSTTLGHPSGRPSIAPQQVYAQSQDARLSPMDIQRVNMASENTIQPIGQDGRRAGPHMGSSGQVLNISYPLQQINYMPIEVL